MQYNVVSGFPFGINATGGGNSIRNTLVTDCLFGISTGLGGAGNQVVLNKINCRECREPPGVFSDFDGEFPVALADENDMCDNNIRSENLQLTTCAEEPSFSTDQCELGQADSPTESPSQSPYNSRWCPRKQLPRATVRTLHGRRNDSGFRYYRQLFCRGAPNAKGLGRDPRNSPVAPVERGAFTLGDSNLGKLHFDACFILVNGDRVRIANILVLRPQGFAGISLVGDESTLDNSELQGSDIDGPPIGVQVSEG